MLVPFALVDTSAGPNGVPMLVPMLGDRCASVDDVAIQVEIEAKRGPQGPSSAPWGFYRIAWTPMRRCLVLALCQVSRIYLILGLRLLFGVYLILGLCSVLWFCLVAGLCPVSRLCLLLGV